MAYNVAGLNVKDRPQGRALYPILLTWAAKPRVRTILV